MKSILRRTSIIAALLLLSGQSSQAVLFTSSGINTASAQAHSLGASANFTLSGTTLTIVLTNTSTQTYATSSLQSSDVLMALFWDINNNPTTLNYNSASVTPGSSLIQTSLSGTPTDLRSSNVSGGIQGGWQYIGPTTTVNPPSLNGITQHYGLGSVGLGIFTGGFVKSSQTWGSNVDFGLVNNAYVAGQSQPTSLNNTPFVRNSITFTFTNMPTNFSLNDVSNVRFQYGSILSDANFTGNIIIPTPEPATFASGFVLLVGSLLRLRATSKRRSQIA